MNKADYLTRFSQLTGGFKPHSWQLQLATHDLCENRLIRIPTGMGKTLGVLSTWLLCRVLNGNDAWPTRLVWCLPMRTLVEQTVSEAEKIIKALAIDNQVDVHPLMGGTAEKRWYQKPDRPAILVGTQDMLLSRALNRGYAMGRAAWPCAFGLLNTDALWVMDEVQLMGVGLATSGQIQSFWNERHENSNSNVVSATKPRVTWWMSATLQPDWLKTPETESLVTSISEEILTIDAGDRNGSQWEATKPVAIEELELDCSSSTKAKANAPGCADLILERHQNHDSNPCYGKQTLVVVNRVTTATEIFKKLQVSLEKQDTEIEAHLVHSRFRPVDREGWIERFLSKASLNSETNRILIATQVVEAGVDISATCLITELAPWPSLVQRFGRAARYDGNAKVIVLDPQIEDDQKAVPYSVTELDSARSAVNKVDDVGIGSLEDFEASLSVERLAELYPYRPLHVILEDEFNELFDTGPDLSGADVDVSRFIREGEDRDIKVFWRDWGEGDPSSRIRAQRRELCSVPIGAAKKWLDKDYVKKLAWTWDYLDGIWIPVDANKLKPAQIVLVAPAVGGYSPDLGFTGTKPGKKDEPISEVHESKFTDSSNAGEHAEESEELSAREIWKTIATHSREAAQVATDLMNALGVEENLATIVTLALRLHDWGKAHPAFASGTYHVKPQRVDLAKAPDHAWRHGKQIYSTPTHGPRRGFRHELASCLGTLELLRCADPHHQAILGQHADLLKACEIVALLPTQSVESNSIVEQLRSLSTNEFNLLLYLIASHHGKVRASMQASPLDQEFPFENKDYVGEGLPVRGLRTGDILPPVDLPAADGNVTMPELTLSLDPAEMGLSATYGASWTERVQGLIGAYGPFTLGWLEAIVRAADGQSSDDTRPPGDKDDPLLAGFQLSVPAANADVAKANQSASDSKAAAEESEPTHV